MKFKTQLSIVHLFLILFLCITSAVMYRATTTLIDNTGLVTHTTNVISKVNVLVKAMVDMETGQRGFMLTGNERFLDPFFSGELAFNKTLENVIVLVSDNPPQVKRLRKIRELKEYWLKYAGEYEINLKRQIDLGKLPAEALTNILQGKTIAGGPQPDAKRSGKQIMDEIRRVVENFIMIESTLMGERTRESSATGVMAKKTAVVGAILAIFLGGGGMWLMGRQLMGQLGAEPSALIAMSKDVASGKMNTRLKLSEATTNAKSNVARALNHMARRLEENMEKLQKQTWQETSRNQLHEQMRGQHDLNDLAKRIITQLCKQVSAEMGAIYCVEESTDLTLMASYALSQSSQASKRIAQGEGLVGQAASERRMIVITEVPEDYFPISSALGQAIPRSVLVLPFITDQELVGVIELCSLRLLSEEHIRFIESVAEGIAVMIKAAQNRSHMELLLAHTKQQAEQHEYHEEELMASRGIGEEHARV